MEVNFKGYGFTNAYEKEDRIWFSVSYKPDCVYTESELEFIRALVMVGLEHWNQLEELWDILNEDDEEALTIWRLKYGS